MMKVLLVLLLLGSSLANAVDPLFPCQCSLATPTWNEPLRSVIYPNRFLIYETPLATTLNPNPVPVPVGEIWDKTVAARASYELEIWRGLVAFQTWYATLPLPTNGIITLSAAQVTALQAAKTGADTVVAKVRALAAKP